MALAGGDEDEEEKVAIPLLKKGDTVACQLPPVIDEGVTKPPPYVATDLCYRNDFRLGRVI